MTFDIETAVNYFWLLALAINGLNAIILWVRAQADIRLNPTLRASYIRLIRGFLIGMSIPWIVMGLGMTLGKVIDIADYFYPREGNPWVLAWWISIWALILYFSHWLYVRAGAETLSKHPALFRNQSVSPKSIKLIWLTNLVSGIIIQIILYSMTAR